MSLYHLVVAAHLLAVVLWIGHMFFWSIVAGPALKAVQPPEEATFLRERMRYLGGLGWPALAVLVPSGLYLSWLRGISPLDLVTFSFVDRPDGVALAIKLGLVLWMILYQAIWGHRPAAVAAWVNMAAAATILACSVVIVRGWT